MRACVTGSSTGIGRAIALELAQSGFEVIVHGKSESAALDETLHLVSDHHNKAIKLVADFTDGESIRKFVASAFPEDRPIDVWVNNAGADVLTGDNKDKGFSEKLDVLWQVDVKATLIISRLVASRMRNRQDSNLPLAVKGSIINIGWDQAGTGIADESGQLFSTTKGAIMTMTGSLAKHFAPDVRVNCVAPGWIKTTWGENTSNYWNQKAIEDCLLKRWGTPQDVANVVAFLASDKSEFINGQIIAVNGGFAGHNTREDD